MDLIRPTRGRAQIFGLDALRDSIAIKRMVGYLPGELPRFERLRGAEVVTYLAGLGTGADRARVRELAERFDLDLGRRYRDYSRGNKQKLGLVLAFMRRPRLVILDEPTSGLDPLNQRQFHELVEAERELGTTVFLSSHVLSEVEQVCRRVAILKAGRLVQVAAIEELHGLRTRRVEVTFAGPPPIDRLQRVGVLTDLAVDGNRVTGTVRGVFGPLLDALAGTGVVSLTSQAPSLEEEFFQYYGRA